MFNSLHFRLNPSEDFVTTTLHTVTQPASATNSHLIEHVYWENVSIDFNLRSVTMGQIEIESSFFVAFCGEFV